MIDIIVNPVANGKKALKCAAAAEKRLKERGAEYRIHYTNAPKHATEIARELSKTSDTIVALGGDGTMKKMKVTVEEGLAPNTAPNIRPPPPIEMVTVGDYYEIQKQVASRGPPASSRPTPGRPAGPRPAAAAAAPAAPAPSREYSP